jgi:hypothetical protein
LLDPGNGILTRPHELDLLVTRCGKIGNAKRDTHRAAASAEYLAQFRTDIESFVPFEVVTACVGDHVEMAPLAQHRYSAFVDPSGGSADSFTMAISHRDGERVLIDATREVRPPFSPEAVINDFAVLLQTYRIARVHGDRYAGEFPRELFRKRGVEYGCTEKSKSDLYRDLLPLLNSGRIVLPKSDRLVNHGRAGLAPGPACGSPRPDAATPDT